MEIMNKNTQVKKPKVEIKKIKKKADLLDAAYRLFLVQGVEKTSIEDIAKKAGVAKGTFYLYFKDKSELTDEIILNSSSEIILKVYQERVSYLHETFEELVIDVLNEIIEKLKENTALLSLIHKNVSWNLFKRAMKKDSGESLLDLLKKDEKRYNRNSDVTDDEFERRMFILLEMTTAVAYTTIVKNEPSSIDEMKTTLFRMITKMIRVSV